MSNLIAFLSFLGAALAALYARWAWGEARRANEISVHSNRMDIYRALHNLRFAVQSKGIMIEAQHVAPFYHPSQEARFYFSNADTSQYLIVRNGNEEEGPDGEDISFLIAANTHVEASSLADDILSQEKASKVFKFSSDIYKIGIADFPSESPFILVCPIIKYFNIPSPCKSIRKDHCKLW